MKDTINNAIENIKQPLVDTIEVDKNSENIVEKNSKTKQKKLN